MTYHTNTHGLETYLLLNGRIRLHLLLPRKSHMPLDAYHTERDRVHTREIYQATPRMIYLYSSRGSQLPDYSYYRSPLQALENVRRNRQFWGSLHT